MIGDAGSAPPVARSRRHNLSLALALGAAAAVFVVTLGAQLAGWLTGWPLVVLGAAAALAIPSSREASRRVFLFGCVALGAAPLVWWLPLPLDGATRFGFIAAVILALLTALVIGGRLSLRALLPRFRAADALTAGALVFTTWTLFPLLAVTGGGTAMRILRDGWDYAAHFNMAEMIRRSGSLVELAAPGPFGSWYYADYPKGFHAAAATLMEVTVGTRIGSADAELVGFLHAAALLGIAAVTTVAAGLASLPQARRSPLVAAPLIALVTLAFVIGPGGGSLIRAGFPNFLIAVALLGCIPLIVIPMERIVQAGPLLTLSGALIGIAHNWPLLLIPAVAGLLPALLPARRRRWPSSRRAWAVLGTAIAVTLVGGLAAWSTLMGGTGGAGTAELLVTPGGFIGGSLIEIVLPCLVAITICVAVGWGFVRRTGGARRGSALRTAALVIFPVAGLGALAGLAAFQLGRAGELSYYFYKLGAGVQLASVVLAAAATSVLVPLARRAARRGLLVAATCVVVVLLATSSGLVNPTSEAVAIRPPPGLEARESWNDILSTPAGDADAEALDVIHAASAVGGGAQHFWVPSTLHGTTPRLSNQWLFALTGQWSASAYEVVDRLWGDDVPPADRPTSFEEAAVLIQQAAPDSVIVVHPESVDRLRDEPLIDDTRLVTW